MPNSKFLLYILLALILMILSAVFGYTLRTKSGIGLTNPPSLNTANDAVFTNQSAAVQGKITKINGKTLTVQNSANNKTADFMVSERVFITKFSSPATPSSPSSDLKQIETGKEVFINLQLTNGSYQVVSIAYLPPAQALPSLLPKASSQK